MHSTYLRRENLYSFVSQNPSPSFFILRLIIAKYRCSNHSRSRFSQHPIWVECAPYWLGLMAASFLLYRLTSAIFLGPVYGAHYNYYN